MMTPITDIDLYPLPGNGRGNNNPDHMGNCTFHLAIDFIVFDAAPLRLFWWLTVRPFCGWRRVPELPTAGVRGFCGHRHHLPTAETTGGTLGHR